jgi:cytochrome P450
MEAQALIAVHEHETQQKNMSQLPYHRNPRERLAIFRAVLQHDGLPPDEKVFNRISHEAVTIIAAGGETTASALMMATYFILADKKNILSRLREEIDSIVSTKDPKPSVAELEHLPWLVRVAPTLVMASSKLT